MRTEDIMEQQGTDEIEETTGEQGSYHRPEVHDLGTLELLEGGGGNNSDGTHLYLRRS